MQDFRLAGPYGSDDSPLQGRSGAELRSSVRPMAEHLAGFARLGESVRGDLTPCNRSCSESRLAVIMSTVKCIGKADQLIPGRLSYPAPVVPGGASLPSLWHGCLERQVRPRSLLPGAAAFCFLGLSFSLRRGWMWGLIWRRGRRWRWGCFGVRRRNTGTMPDKERLTL